MRSIKEKFAEEREILGIQGGNDLRKKMIIVVMCVILFIQMLPLNVAAAMDTKIIITADKKEAHSGEVITYTIMFGPVEDMQGAEFKLSIPDGLTYIEHSGQVTEELEVILGAEKAEFIEASKKFVAVGGGHYTSSENTDIMTFQCRVDVEAPRELSIALMQPDISDSKWEGIAFTIDGDGANVKVLEKTTSCEHMNKSLIEAVDSTCSVQGWDSYYQCHDCGNMLGLDGSTIMYDIPYRNLVPHQLFGEVVSAEHLKTLGTCIEQAVYYKSCTVCGINGTDTFLGEKDSMNHVGGTEIINQKDATAVAEGYTGDTVCRACGTILKTGVPIAVTDQNVPKPGQDDDSGVSEDSEGTDNTEEPEQDEQPGIAGILGNFMSPQTGNDDSVAWFLILFPAVVIVIGGVGVSWYLKKKRYMDTKGD